MHEDAWLKLTRKARGSASSAAAEPDRGAFYTVDFAPRTVTSDKTGRKIVGTVYIWDGAVMAEEAPLDADGNVDFDNAIRWHYEPESVVPLARQNPDGTLWYVVADHLGTPREMFTETGQLVWAAEYRSWGAVRRLWRKPPTANDDGLTGLGALDGKPPATSPPGTGGIGVYTTGIGPGGGRGGISGNLALADTAEWYEATMLCPIRFQGQWEGAETGLYYNRFRYYDPLIGQYLSPDPIGLTGGLRTHGYVDNPNAWVDPLGLAKVCCFSLTGPSSNFQNYLARERRILNETQVRQHILYGDATGGGHLYPGLPGKTAFPQSWSPYKVMYNVNDIVTSPSTRWYAQSGNGGMFTANGAPARWRTWDIRDNVRIRVVYEPAGKGLVTAHPDPYIPATGVPIR